MEIQDQGAGGGVGKWRDLRYVLKTKLVRLYMLTVALGGKEGRRMTLRV